MVPAGYLKGRAFLVYWSFEEEPAETSEAAGLREKLRRLSQVALNFFSRTRWSRTARIVR
jgi:hypothetical protein